jgi:hypothetical protein
MGRMMLRTSSRAARLERPVKNSNQFKNLALDARGRSLAAVVAHRLLQTVHDSKMMADLAVLAALNRNALKRNDFEDRQPRLPSDQFLSLADLLGCSIGGHTMPMRSPST